MKKFVALIAVTALAACAEAEAPMVDENIIDETAASYAALPAGEYTLAYGDQTTGTFTVNDDWTYSVTNSEGSVSGAYEDVDGKTCFTEEGAEEASCWTNGAPADDGSFSSTSDDGDTVTVTPVAASADEAPAE